jgi:hypothetical protein
MLSAVLYIGAEVILIITILLAGRGERAWSIFRKKGGKSRMWSPFAGQAHAQGARAFPPASMKG